MRDLLPGLALYALLGVALTAYLWGAGLGVLTAIRLRPAVPDRSRDAVYAFPLGVVWLTAASFLLVGPPALVALGVVVVAAPIVMLALRGRHWLPVGRVLALPVAVAAGFAFVFVLVLTRVWHGPTSTLASNPFGDTVWAVSKTIDAHVSLMPYRDLAAEGQTYGYAESAPHIVGGALLGIPSFDVFAYFEAAVPMVLILSLAAGFALVAFQARRLSIVEIAVVTFLATAMLADPTWPSRTPSSASACRSPSRSTGCGRTRGRSGRRCSSSSRRSASPCT